jgi:uncharacterized protein YgfB (UPF0149 family)
MRYKITMVANKNAVEPIPDLDEMAKYYGAEDDEPTEEEQFDFEEYSDYINGLIAMLEERADDERR